jgi:hypothetical protein
VPITQLDRDSAADPFDGADFELPDGKTMIEQLMAGLAQARSKGLVPKASEEILRAFSVSKMKLYKHATTHKYVICQVYVIHIPLCRYKYVTHIEV